MSQESSSAETLTIDVQRRGQTVIAKLAGYANMETSSELQDRLVGLIDEQTRQLILDLSELEFISSPGLGALIAAHLQCRHNKGVVKLIEPKPPIMKLLEVTKLNKLFPIFDSVDAAIDAQ
jgi:anti-sigma B factor antagonist